MAALDFPDPAVTQEFEAAGILWTWNATLGVWSSETTTAFDAGDLYLSKRNDDAADGNIEFKGLTTHQQGVQLPNLTNTASLATDVDGNIIAGTGGGGSGGSDFGKAEADTLYLSKVNNDTAKGEIDFEKISIHRGGVRINDIQNAPFLITNANGNIQTGSYTTLDNRYLSKTDNDTAAGAISFDKLSTHKGGVRLSDYTNAPFLVTNANGDIRAGNYSTLDNRYLSKTDADTAAGTITFSTGIDVPGATRLTHPTEIARGLGNSQKINFISDNTGNKIESLSGASKNFVFTSDQDFTVTADRNVGINTSNAITLNVPTNFKINGPLTTYYRSNGSDVSSTSKLTASDYCSLREDVPAKSWNDGGCRYHSRKAQSSRVVA